MVSLIIQLDNYKNLSKFYSRIFLYGEIIWLTLMGIACISFTFYSIKLRKLLTKSLSAVRGSQDRRAVYEQGKVMRRLSLVSILLSLFFTLQTLIGIYGIYVQLSNINYDISMAIFDLFLNLMYLASFLYLYIPNINRVIKSKKRSYEYFILFVKVC